MEGKERKGICDTKAWKYLQKMHVTHKKENTWFYSTVCHHKQISWDLNNFSLFSLIEHEFEAKFAALPILKWLEYKFCTRRGFTYTRWAPSTRKMKHRPRPLWKGLLGTCSVHFSRFYRACFQKFSNHFNPTSPLWNQFASPSLHKDPHLTEILRAPGVSVTPLIHNKLKEIQPFAMLRNWRKLLSKRNNKLCRQ